MSIVSVFKNCYSTASVEDIEFLDVLHRIKGGYWQDEYFTYRSTLKNNGPDAPGTKKAKEQLACFAPSGQFSGGRRRANLIGHSGILNIDIDAKHNLGIDLPEYVFDPGTIEVLFTVDHPASLVNLIWLKLDRS